MNFLFCVFYRQQVLGKRFWKDFHLFAFATNKVNMDLECFKGASIIRQSNI